MRPAEFAQAPARRPAGSAGLLPWVLPAMLLVGALDTSLSGRDLAQSFYDLEQVAEVARHPLATWVQRGVSLLLLAAAVEQVANHLALRRPVPSPALLAAFVGYWLGTIALPAVFAAHPGISHELLYAAAVGVAACLCDQDEREHLLRRARDGLVLLMAAGLAMAALRPSLVLDLSYADGLLPGVPRFAGLTAHPVTQGMLAQVALLVLWACPYRARLMRWAAWALAAGVLVLAQSKTAWLAFVACALAMAWVRHGAGLWRRMTDPRGGGALGLLVLGGLAAAVLAVGVLLVAGDPGDRLEAFLSSRQGAQLATLTGRDRIWAVALEEWQAHPVFGYGLSLWDAIYRAQIGMPHATHAHNQFLDDAARAGGVGALALVVYAAALAVLAVRGARASGGLSLALFVAVALRGVSEVPLSLLGYGTELFTHLLLLSTLSAAALARRQAPRRRAPLRYGVAS